MTIALINDPSLVQPCWISWASTPYQPARHDGQFDPAAYVRHGRMRSVYTIGDGEAEVIEAQVLGTSSGIAGKMIRDTDVPESALIGLIRKGDRVITPRGSTRIEEGDILTIFAMRDAVAEVERLFQVGLDFF
jgi:trk system potassium uptake protein